MTSQPFRHSVEHPCRTWPDIGLLANVIVTMSWCALSERNITLSYNMYRIQRKIIPLYSKAVPLQAWSDPEGSRKLRFPDFMTRAQDGGKVVSLTHRPPLPYEMLLVLISVTGWADLRAIVRSEGFYVNEKFQWHQLGSNQRPSNL